MTQPDALGGESPETDSLMESRLMKDAQRGWKDALVNHAHSLEKRLTATAAALEEAKGRADGQLEVEIELLEALQALVGFYRSYPTYKPVTPDMRKYFDGAVETWKKHSV